MPNKHPRTFAPCRVQAETTGNGGEDASGGEIGRPGATERVQPLRTGRVCPSCRFATLHVRRTRTEFDAETFIIRRLLRCLNCGIRARSVEKISSFVIPPEERAFFLGNLPESVCPAPFDEET